MKSKTNIRGWTLKEYLRQSRKAAGLSQKEVAKYLGYGSAQIISNWERGVACFPPSRLTEIARLYKLEPRQLLDILIEEFVGILFQELPFRKVQSLLILKMLENHHEGKKRERN